MSYDPKQKSDINTVAVHPNERPRGRGQPWEKKGAPRGDRKGAHAGWQYRGPLALFRPLLSPSGLVIQFCVRRRALQKEAHTVRACAFDAMYCIHDLGSGPRVLEIEHSLTPVTLISFPCLTAKQTSFSPDIAPSFHDRSRKTVERKISL